MTGVVLDTNIYSAILNEEEAVVARFRRIQIVQLPIVVVAELRAGFIGGNRPMDNEKRLESFLSAERVAVLNIDERTTRIYAEMASDLKRRGRAVPQNDIWIGALTLQFGGTLWSRDKHFEYLPRVPRVLPV